MKIFLVRIFNNNKWHTIRTYSILEEANCFAGTLQGIEWDVKEVTLLQALAEAIKTAAPNTPTPHAWKDYVVTTTVLEELPRVDDFGGIEHMPTSAANPIAESHADVRAQTRPRTLARNPA